MSHPHFMVDNETLATTPDAAIVSIGACSIEHPTNRFYVEIDFQAELEEAPRLIDPETMAWWDKQSEEARAVLTRGTVPLGKALIDFVSWVHSLGPHPRPWSNGATFDVVMIEHALRQYGIPCPWKFWNVCDQRTLIMMTKVITGQKMKPEREGTHHNALDDAVFQAQWVSDCFKALKADFSLEENR